MDITILRGKEKIGETLIEVKEEGKRVLLECGIALEETDGCGDFAAGS